MARLDTVIHKYNYNTNTDTKIASTMEYRYKMQGNMTKYKINKMVQQ